MKNLDDINRTNRILILGLQTEIRDALFGKVSPGNHPWIVSIIASVMSPILVRTDKETMNRIDDERGYSFLFERN